TSALAAKAPNSRRVIWSIVSLLAPGLRAIALLGLLASGRAPSTAPANPPPPGERTKQYRPVSGPTTASCHRPKYRLRQSRDTRRRRSGSSPYISPRGPARCKKFVALDWRWRNAPNAAQSARSLQRRG